MGDRHHHYHAYDQRADQEPQNWVIPMIDMRRRASHVTCKAATHSRRRRAVESLRVSELQESALSTFADLGLSDCAV